ncbi:LysR family transcriptional regulator [Pseudoalteromonas denitrificans]|uniref:DNA-binding transcriptional regulator, LysR family n=1 Tax=Pseudoalteromonas denitrificans DSM 6059 TaxID=1123010 RepID=A0A1I1PYE7_9GAMM|nr:LysR family transcriptional regulator [Pseudoalteromonas denitrificans]SFD14692.1 DNA-binding transcriptional regulator, LysR family [Pseudoalteromonas denitrificans DSM 6059]
MNLHQLDLNLLVIFDALYRHKSVSMAANEICLSQSAFSHGLSRLRKRLNDALFIRINNVMEPTYRAQEMAIHLNKALPLMFNAINETTRFDPATDTSEFKFSATDYTEFSLLPKLIGKINKIAPNIKINIIAAKEQHPLTQLESYDVDFALGYSHKIEDSAIIDSLTWLKDSYCTIARSNHPALKNGLSLDNFLHLTHVRVSPWGEKQGVVDQVLAQLKLSRKVALQLPSVLVAPHTVLHSDLLLTIPRVVAEQLATQIKIQIFEPPIRIPDYHLNMYWHKINSNKASFKWMQQQIISTNKNI